jgi:GNAT superfamily N-acetyltransferase
MLIRALEETDIPAVARLFHDVASEFIVHESPPEGASAFLRENDEQALRGHLARGHVYHVALIGDELAGFIAVRDVTHLFHLFVDKHRHGQGVASRLWEAARAASLAAGNPGFFTVNSSNHALPVYAAWGFVRTAPRQFAKGVYYTPMRLDLQQGLVATD